jgi:heterodisulfide reductase subunit C
MSEDTTQPQSARATLRNLVRDATGYDVRRCGRCSYCVHFVTPEDDLSLEVMMQLVLQNDEEVLTSKTLWSDEALKRARQMCISTMDVVAIMLALRAEARQRGLISEMSSSHTTNGAL